MQRLKALDELTPADLWREIPESEEEFWHDAREKQQRLVKTVLEGVLEEEMITLLAAGRYKRVDDRRGYRNGFYQRDLLTQIGIVSAIRVPRARGAQAERSVFSRYQRRQGHVNQAIRKTFLAGVSTRRVGEVLEGFLGEGVSAQTVSRVTPQPGSPGRTVPDSAHRRRHPLLAFGRCLSARQERCRRTAQAGALRLRHYHNG